MQIHKEPDIHIVDEPKQRRDLLSFLSAEGILIEPFQLDRVLLLQCSIESVQPVTRGSIAEWSFLITVTTDSNKRKKE